MASLKKWLRFSRRSKRERKHEESVKAGVDSTHTQGACGGESIGSPTVNVLHSPTIDVEDDYSEYEDRMDISKLVSKEPLVKQVTQASSSILPEGTVEEAVAPPRVRSFSVTTQTESSPPSLPVKSRSLSSSFVRAPFQFNNYPSESRVGAKKVVYDVPRAPSIDDHQVYPCCGLFKLEKWEVHYHSCADIIQPYRRQLLESETSFCDICHKDCTSPADFVVHQERVHLCLPLFVCPVCHFTYILPILVYVCTSPNLMVVQKQQFL